MRRFWDIHGVGVRVESELGVPQVLDYGLRHHRTDADHRPADVNIQIAARTADSCPAQGRRIYFHRPLPVDGRLDGDRLWLGAGGGSLRADLATGESHIAAPDADWLAQPTVVRTLLPVAIMLPLMRHDLFYVHAAILVDPAGHGWLLAGGGGVGKSTTTYRLLEQGWSWVCDDSGLLCDDGGRVVARSFWDEMQLDQHSARRLAGVHWETPAVAQQKGVVATERTFGAQRRDGCELSHLVLLRREGGAGTVDRARFLAALVKDNPLMLVTATRANFDQYARLVGQCDLGHICVGEELLEDPERVLRASMQSRHKDGTVDATGLHYSQR